MKHARLRMLSVLVATGLIAGSAVVPSMAQDASPSPDVPMLTVPTAEDFMASLTAILPSQESVEAGDLKGVRQFAEQTRAYLLSVTPDPCYHNMYASAWGVATALQQWADKALRKPEVLLRNTYNQLVESPQAISCGEPMAEESPADL